MNSLSWKKEVKLQHRKTLDDAWQDLYIVVFEATDEGKVNLSYVDRTKKCGGGIAHETRVIKELLGAKVGLRLIKK